MKYKMPEPVGVALSIASVVALRASAAAASPPNDAISGAAAIGALPFRAALDTTGATSAADDPVYAGQGSTVWYTFTSTSDVRVLVDTIGSDFDTTLSIYTGSPGALTMVAWDDDSAGGDQSRLLLQAKRGVTYHLMVGAFSGSAPGTLVLSAAVAPPPPTVAVQVEPGAAIDGGTGAAKVRGSVKCSTPALVCLFGELREDGASPAASGSVFTCVMCDGETPFAVDVAPRATPFSAGAARFAATAAGTSQRTGENTDTIVDADVTLTVP